jgi:hypothetical protein
MLVYYDCKLSISYKSIFIESDNGCRSIKCSNVTAYLQCLICVRLHPQCQLCRLFFIKPGNGVRSSMASNTIVGALPIETPPVVRRHASLCILCSSAEAVVRADLCHHTKMRRSNDHSVNLSHHCRHEAPSLTNHMRTLIALSFTRFI